MTEADIISPWSSVGSCGESGDRLREGVSYGGCSELE